MDDQSQLHAGLVNQILTLQRDRDSSLSFMEKLEHALAQAQAHNEALQADLERQHKEKDESERHIQSVEDTTLLALAELCRERDAARASAEDMRLKRESIQRRLKREQDEVDQSQKKLEQERLKWEDEKKALQLKADVARARLENVLKELAERDEAAANVEENETTPRQSSDSNETERGVDHHEGRLHQSGSGETISSIRRMSENHGKSLADELAGANGEDEEDEQDLLLTTRPSIGNSISPSLDVSTRPSLDFVDEPFRQARVVRLSQTFSSEKVSTIIHTPNRQSLIMDDVFLSSKSGSPEQRRSDDSLDARELTEVLGSLSDLREMPEDDEVASSFDDQLLVESPRSEQLSDPAIPEYVSTGIQYTPQASPRKTLSQRDMHDLLCQTAPESGANQRRKRTSARDVESSVIEEVTNPDSAIPVASSTEMQSSSTQTEPEAQEDVSEISPRYATVPVIRIQAPSQPGSVRTSVLLPFTASVGSQTIVTSFVDMVSTGMQTDKIRVDLRGSNVSQHIKDLLARSHPDDESSGQQQNQKNFSHEEEEPSEQPNSQPSSTDFQTPEARKDSYAQIESHWAGLKQSLLQTDRQLQDPPAIVNDPYFPPTHRKDKRQRHFRTSFFIPPTPVPEVDNEDISPPHLPNADFADRSSFDKTTYSYTIGARPFPARTSSLPFDADTSYLKHYSSQGSLHSNGSGSFGGPPPPFAIPKRRSSRQLRLEAAEDTSTPSRRPNVSPKKRAKKTSPSKPVVRRSRTGPAGVRKSADYSRSRPSSKPRTPKRRPAELQSLARPALDRLESNDSFFGHQRAQPSQDLDTTNHRISMIMSSSGPFSPSSPINEAEGETNPTIIDAIAATMVGEWMWKYVKGKDDFLSNPSHASAARHKRWVWLSPNDGTVLWASKRPTSSAALVGKSDRKMVVQSVFDVKNPATAAGADAEGDVYDRSIIIVTPSRALKFTATSEERHYRWLTALTFLSKQTSKHDSINLDIPITRRRVEEQDENSTLASKNSQPVASLPQGNGTGPVNTQTRFPFPFGGSTFSCTTSTAASAAVSPIRPPHASGLPASPSPLASMAPFTYFPATANTDGINPLNSNPTHPIVQDDNNDEDYAYPTVPRLPSTSTSNSRRPSTSSATAKASATASLRKKTSNLSLRPSSTRARSSVEVPRTSFGSERWGVRPAFFRATKSAEPKREARMGPTWPATPPRSSEEPEVEGDVEFDLGEDEYQELDQEDEQAEVEVEVDDVQAISSSTVSSPAFASNASFFGALTSQGYRPTPARSHDVRQGPEVEELDTSRTSDDSVAPPSIRTVRGKGVRRSGGGGIAGGVGRRLWRS